MLQVNGQIFRYGGSTCLGQPYAPFAKNKLFFSKWRCYCLAWYFGRSIVTGRQRSKRWALKPKAWSRVSAPSLGLFPPLFSQKKHTSLGSHHLSDPWPLIRVFPLAVHTPSPTYWVLSRESFTLICCLLGFFVQDTLRMLYYALRTSLLDLLCRTW